MKKILLAFFLFLIIFIIQTPPSVSASCIKSAGGVSDMCIGYIRCPVHPYIYCCDTQPECQALQGATNPVCVGLGGTCHLESDVCQTDLGLADCPQFQKCGASCSTSTNPICNADLWCDCGSGTTGTKLKTAIGCIPILSTKEEFLSFVLKWAVGIGGGIAFLLIIYAGFMIMTSAGNPERLKAGQELLTSAISGLILLIFSVVILKIIGVDILGLNQFGFNQ